MALKILLKGLRQFAFQNNYRDTAIKHWGTVPKDLQIFKKPGKILALVKKWMDSKALININVYLINIFLLKIYQLQLISRVIYSCTCLCFMWYES